MVPLSISHLPARADGLRRRLTDWCGVNSGSANLAGLSRMAALLKQACLELSSDAAEFPVSTDGRVAIRARQRPRAPMQILLCGHYDTVYPPDHPFQRCSILSPGILNGPGAADMKGGLVLLFAALAAFEETPAAANLGWEVLLTPDEETGSVASRAILEEAARRHQLGLVFEPGRENGDIVLVRRGVGVATVTAHGRSSHAGAAPKEGRNAILALSEFLVNTRGLSSDLPGVSLNVGEISGGGALNVVPELARAKLDVRIDQRAEWDALPARLESCAASINQREGYRIEFELRLTRPPLEISPLAEAAFARWAECGRSLNLAPFGWQRVGGGSDANLLSAAGLPCLDGLGPRGGAYHTGKEWVDLNSLVERAQLAALFLHRLANGEIRPVYTKDLSAS